MPISHRFDLSRSKKTVPNETSYVTSYMSIMVTNPHLAQFSRYKPKQCYHGGKKTNMAAKSPFFKSNRK